MTGQERRAGRDSISIAISAGRGCRVFVDRNRECKAVLFAHDRIPIYWIVNLIDKRVEVYTDPSSGKAPGYRHRKDSGEGDVIPLIIAGRKVGQIAVKDLLP